MADQLTLQLNAGRGLPVPDDCRDCPLDWHRGTRHWCAWWRFHKSHPEVAVECLALARRVRKRGHRRYGMKTIFEVLRYHSDVGRNHASRPRINNNFAPFYTRYLAMLDPEVGELFSTRETGREDISDYLNDDTPDYTEEECHV